MKQTNRCKKCNRTICGTPVFRGGYGHVHQSCNEALDREQGVDAPKAGDGDKPKAAGPGGFGWPWGTTR